MILELNIKNFAIINDLKISFTKGFNVLTGETGAGKSIIIDAVGLILGDRSNKDFIKIGQDKSIIEALFYLENSSHVKELLRSYGIQYELDDTLLITREIHKNGRSFSRVNGHTITLNMLRKITSSLVDIYGQHEHQSLLNSENHIELIDLLGDNDLLLHKKEIRRNYLQLNELKNKLSKIVTDEKERERKIDLLKFQIDEIDSGSLKSNEENELINEYTKLSNLEEIAKKLNSIHSILDSNDYNNSSVIDELNKVSNILNNISKFDNNIKEYETNINETIYQIQDLIRDIRNYYENIDYDIEKLSILEERMELINKLKRKYGNTIDEILEYRDNIEEELNIIINNKKQITVLKSNIEQLNIKILKESKILSKKRIKVIKAFEKKMIDELYNLNMKNIKFKVSHEILNNSNINGIDKIEFLISTNLGEPLRKLSKIVSGGEMSRIMLAFKSIIVGVDNISTMIFDEIDSGISGRTAQIVGEKIVNISRNHQVLCITHLPQIAAMSDSHYLIKKIENNGNVRTIVSRLDYNSKIEELSRLLGGVDLTDTTRLHAEEMIKMSKKYK
ncbi:DNA repair protein RecN [Senegalia massiliensis]|uniref:DNA repair protein RecN n=1 Tax=Senegalia massiliensis TaxID=1720316 RepID=A0A845QUR7_9CLOT|nr:DNA repair protein RecN [Senegalia massiliensis]NBI06637.1 DNA repair protein RecN [Senegalia massiliensis]